METKVVVYAFGRMTVDVKNTQTYELEHKNALPLFPNIIAAKMCPPPVTRYVAFVCDIACTFEWT
jgi:hypothetical protein